MTDLDTALRAVRRKIEYQNGGRCPETHGSVIENGVLGVLVDHIAAQAAELAHLRERIETLRDTADRATFRADQAERERDALAEKWSFVFAGHAVYSSLTHQQTLRTSPENVSDTLDALVRAAKGASEND